MDKDAAELGDADKDADKDVGAGVGANVGADVTYSNGEEIRPQENSRGAKGLAPCRRMRTATTVAPHPAKAQDLPPLPLSYTSHRSLLKPHPAHIPSSGISTFGSLL